MKQKTLSDALFSIAWGYVLIHLHFNVGPADILPDWLGYILFYFAMNTLKESEPSLKNLQPITIILTIWDVALMFIPAISTFSVIITILSLYFHYQFLTSLASIATKNQCTQGESLLRLRIARTILIALFAIPVDWNSFVIIVYLLLIANLVVAIWLCVVMFSFRKSLKVREMTIGIE